MNIFEDLIGCAARLSASWSGLNGEFPSVANLLVEMIINTMKGEGGRREERKTSGRRAEHSRALVHCFTGFSLSSLPTSSHPSPTLHTGGVKVQCDWVRGGVGQE